MKKLIALVLSLVCVLGLVGCGRTMNDIIENEPNVTGIVEEVHDNYIVMYAETADGYPNGTRWSISLNVENKDSYTDIVVGDEIVVYYDGMAMETDPLQVSTVYAITLKTPANRECVQTGQTQSAHLLSVNVKVIEVVNDTTFTVEVLADCSDKITTGDIISVSTDFESVADILGNYQESNHFKIYFPTVGETDAGLSVTCFDAVQYDADGECLELPDIEADTVQYLDKTLNKSDLSAETLEWLEWFNGLSETGQLSVSFVPHEILELCGYVSTENSEVSGPAE